MHTPPVVIRQKTWSYIGVGVLWLIGVFILVSGEVRARPHSREEPGVHSAR